jgi:hypothetical protein
VRAVRFIRVRKSSGFENLALAKVGPGSMLIDYVRRSNW